MIRNGLELADARVVYGRSAESWAGKGNVRIDDGRWLALTGARSTLLNAGLCHGPAGGAWLLPTAEEVTDRKVPIAIGVVGEALGAVGQLAELNWICVGALPFMVLDIPDQPLDPGVRMLSEPEEFVQGRQLISDAFGLSTTLSSVALPFTESAASSGERWGLFDNGAMVSCLGTSIVDDIAVVWSMATPAADRRRGYGRRLLLGALAKCRAQGATTCLLLSSDRGRDFYVSVGFETLEWWQMWSRPRWVFARS